MTINFQLSTFKHTEELDAGVHLILKNDGFEAFFESF